MATGHRLRRLIVGLLIVLTCLTAVVATVAIWARATALNTDRWTRLAEEVIREPEVVDALSARLSTSIVDGLQVEDRIRTALAGAERLPAQATVLAQPLTERIQDFLEARIAGFLASDAGQDLWVRLNRAVHERVVALLRGETRPGVTVEGGTVTLNTTVIINRVLAGTEDLVSDIIGRPVTLPSAEELEASGGPDQARALLEERLGVDLPENFGELVVFRSDRLEAAQDAVRLVDRFIVLILVITLLLVVASLVFSVNRRRTLVQLGIGVLLGAIVARLAVRAVENAIVEGASSRSRGSLQEVVGIVFSGLVDLTAFLVVAGIVLGVAAYLAGRPAWLVRLGDRARTPATSARLQRLGRWARDHSDGLRFGGVVAALVVLYLVDLSWLSVLVILVLLVAYQLAVSALLSLPSQEGEQPEDLQVQPDKG
jgi:Fe-S cluster biogenesis protein NfuA